MGNSADLINVIDDVSLKRWCVEMVINNNAGNYYEIDRIIQEAQKLYTWLTIRIV